MFHVNNGGVHQIDSDGFFVVVCILVVMLQDVAVVGIIVISTGGGVKTFPVDFFRPISV